MTDRDAIHEQKNQYRALMGRKRQLVNRARRRAAIHYSLDILPPLLVEHRYVLSFASFGSEFYTWGLNQLLAKWKALVLPKIENQTLRLYQVTNLNEQLIKSAWGIQEPDSSVCEEIALSDLQAILVPGLAFDSQFHRLGYGKGFYDRLLDQASDDTKAIGIGFIEQLVPQPLPILPHDRPLHDLYLF